MRHFLLLFLLYSSTVTLSAQDLNARVEISAPQVLNANTRTIEVLKKAIFDFLNNKSWTGAAMRPEERIDCSFNIVLSEYDGMDRYTATAQINSVRPVFGTNYNSPILSFRDKYFNFTYTEGEQLDFNDEQNLGALSSLLAFYAYTIVGMDMDTFTKMGGTAMFGKARTIVSYSQSRQDEGWRAMEATDNRYWLINNLNDRKYMPYREFAYLYHREGLDNMMEHETESRKKMGDLLLKLKEVDRSYTGNVWTSALYTAKSNEFTGLFSKMPGNESMKIYNLLAELDPAHLSKYENLKK
ncbi:DUF4835 family protein [Sphingobacterium sp. SGG-5]|uniref:type IX secretion system protein PorD n=1 Tax=Sphingobacterium sp. SGG-5 TaxID=2710881 RepID=UPI0013EC656C|nr:DUF4835 family protein [Sphingobacterium sp. SGG-5]NGM60319.1 DUF4835 family protein [Sphingobacterium sp. SGG-5]